MGLHRQKIKAFMLMVSILIVAVFAGVFALRTTAASISLSTTLDFRSEASQTNNSYGYAWNKDTKTLTLTNFSMVLNTAKDTAIHLPADSTIYLPEGTKNEIVLPESTAILESFFGVRCEGNLTITGKGSLSVRLEQNAARLYGIATNIGKLTIDGSCVNVETAVSLLPATKTEANNRSIAIIAAGKESVFSVKNGASVIALSNGINQTNASAKGNVDAYGVAASKITVENATVFGQVNLSTHAGSGSLMTAGIRADETISISGNSAVSASNACEFSENTPALWGKINFDETSMLLQNMLHAPDAERERYGQSDTAKPMSIGTEATFTAYEGKTYASAEALSSAHSEYTFLGWFDEKGIPYAGELGKAYTAKWAKNGAPLFYGPLDLTNSAPTQSNKEYGYAWDAQTKTLTLSNFHLYAPEGGLGLLLPDGATVVLEANTTSSILADGLTDKGINAAIYTNGTVTFKGQGAVSAKGGDVLQLSVTVVTGMYGSFTVDGPLMHLYGAEINHPGSVGFYIPANGTVVFKEGSLYAYGAGRAGMLSAGATLSVPKKATMKAGNESADLVLSEFDIKNKEKHLSIFEPAQSGTNDSADPDKEGFLKGELGRIVLLIGFVGISVGAVAFFGSLKKKKASEKPSSEGENEAQDKNQSEN